MLNVLSQNENFSLSREQLNVPVQDVIFKDNYYIMAVLVPHKNSTSKQNVSMNSSIDEGEGDVKKVVNFFLKLIFFYLNIITFL